MVVGALDKKYLKFTNLNYFFSNSVKYLNFRIYLTMYIHYTLYLDY